MKNMTKEDYMKIALYEAQKSLISFDVPIGAVIVKDGKIIAKAHNKKEQKQCAIFHAEILVLEKASKKLKTWHLDDCDIYLTKQPCLMCYGALMSARIKNIYFGAYDKKYGLEVSKYNELNEKGFNHKAHIEGGILEEECSKILSDFFKNIRKK